MLAAEMSSCVWIQLAQTQKTLRLRRETFRKSLLITSSRRLEVRMFEKAGAFNGRPCLL